MTKEQLAEAKEIEEKINRCNRWLTQALRMQTCSYKIKIVESIPNGNQVVLAELSPDDKFIPIISELLIARLTNEITTLETHLNNL